MDTITGLISILTLFYLLGKSADLAINSLREIGKKMGLGIFFLGIIMGFFTSLPELGVGVNSLLNDVADISLGNLLGGTIVLFGLVLGINLILQKKVDSEQKIKHFALILAYLFLPSIFGLNGRIEIIEGIIIVIAYFCLLFMLYSKQKYHLSVISPLERRQFVRRIFLFLAGVVLVLLISHFIVEITVDLLEKFALSNFIIGLLIFSIGTNFPEIIIAVRSWKNKIKELSISNLIGSVMANILIVGIFAIIKPYKMVIDNSYYVYVGGLFILLSSLLIFYKTDKALTRNEGFALLSIYLAFIIVQILVGNKSFIS
ncbi:MAG: hypothetical protein PHO91_02625 [Patescibacteria group bacterium]|nr:hypothetical protein [Patescibacteria group bacterium]